ncbi:hypothetical protein DFH28DRAFT_1217972 [Melampsora americana]|nr:hypothetical protein DFH28DRAFT_1217972 [Melampsora americana]
MLSLNILVLFPTLTLGRFITRDAIANVSTIPTCSVTCSLQVASRTRCSDPTDSSCSCTDPTFRKEILGCYQRQCGEADLELSIALAKNICAKAGHPNLTDTATSNTSITNNATTYPTNSVNLSDPTSVGAGNLTNIKTGNSTSNPSNSTTNTQPINSTVVHGPSISSSSTLQVYSSKILLLSFTIYVTTLFI